MYLEYIFLFYRGIHKIFYNYLPEANLIKNKMPLSAGN